MDLSDISDAMRPIAADYWEDVRAIVREAYDCATNDDEFTQALDESIDGSWWCTYTYAAQAVLMISDNQDAYANMLGVDGLIQDRDRINWEGMAFCAMLADVREYAESVKADYECAECGDVAYGPPTPEGMARYCDGCGAPDA